MRFEELEEQWREREEELLRKVTERIIANTQEKEYREKRLKNVIVSNVAEKEKEQVHER